MAIGGVIASVHEDYLKWRALDRLVQTSQFAEALRLDPNNIELHHCLATGNVTWVDNWVEETLKKDIGELSIRALRLLAASLGITFYTSYSKDQLIQKVTHVRRSQKDVS